MRTVRETVRQPSLLSPARIYRAAGAVADAAMRAVGLLGSRPADSSTCGSPGGEGPAGGDSWSSFFATWQFVCSLAIATLFFVVRLVRSLSQGGRPWPRAAVVAARVALLVWIVGLLINILLNMGSLLNSGGGVLAVVTQSATSAPAAAPPKPHPSRDPPIVAEAVATAVSNAAAVVASVASAAASAAASAVVGMAAPTGSPTPEFASEGSASFVVAADRIDAFDSDELPGWARILADSFFVDILAYEIIMRIYLLLYPSPNGRAPPYHHGSIDGDFLWAAVLHYSASIDLLPFVLFKWLQMAALLCHLASNMIVDDPGWKRMFDGIPRVVHWMRRTHLLWCIFMGRGAPWLLWVPDAILLVAAMLFYIGVETGLEMSPRLVGHDGDLPLDDIDDAMGDGIQVATGNARGVLAMREPSDALATSPAMAAAQRNQLPTAAQAEKLYHDFLTFSAALGSQAGGGQARRADSAGDDDADEDFDDTPWLSENSDAAAADDEPTQRHRGLRRRRSPRRRARAAEGGSSGEQASVSSSQAGDAGRSDDDADEDDVPIEEINDLLKDAYAAAGRSDTDSALDESYLCPDRIFTRQMRRAVLSGAPALPTAGGPQAAGAGTRRRASLPPHLTLSAQSLPLAASGSPPGSPASASGSGTGRPGSPARATAGAHAQRLASAVRDVAARAERFRRVLASHAPVARLVDALLARRRADNQRRNERVLKCVVCRAAMRDIILRPCNHLCLCDGCKTAMGQRGLGRCPVCSREVEGTVKIFWS
ncbi:hypothetical protein HK105_208670 [Polyrhizophydium stewartii]|uniref:RING-type domain-containing protein n=1 Tax=Polyrhizophydium stewartii TaxID=2732419 RepID=A0ABR4MX13_9FUNG